MFKYKVRNAKLILPRTQRGAQAARAGAFGGARQAIENAEANRALASQMDAIRAQGHKLLTIKQFSLCSMAPILDFRVFRERNRDWVLPCKVAS
jgi:hypothetical protein